MVSLTRSVCIGVATVAAILGGCSGGSDDGDAAPIDRPADAVADRDPSASPEDPGTETGDLDVSGLANPLATAREATRPYVTDLARAEADGYQVITPMMPDMGVHYLNPDVSGFDVSRPPILVYVSTEDGGEQLGALEWVFPEEPEEAPLPGAEYGSFGAACHYADGTFLFEEDEAACPTTRPETRAAFSFWHPPLVTLHVWLWYPNPDGLFSGTNPLVRPFTVEPVPPIVSRRVV